MKKNIVERKKSLGQISFLDEIIVDNFAGGGGASTGMELATGECTSVMSATGISRSKT